MSGGSPQRRSGGGGWSQLRAPRSTDGEPGRRSALGRFIVAHWLGVVGEWAVTIAVLVYAYGRSGSGAVGLVSLAALALPLLSVPLVARRVARQRPHSVRLAGLAIQSLAYGGAAVAASADAPTPVVTIGVVIGLAALQTLRPTGAVLLPAMSRRTEELVQGNLWMSYGDSASGLIGPMAAAGFASIGGPAAVFVAFSAASAVAWLVTVWRPGVAALTRPGAAQSGDRNRVLREAIGELRQRRWAIGVIGVSSARNLVVGALDVLLVVIALRALEMGERGPGLLTSLVGAGALASTLVVTVVVRRPHLRTVLLAALAIAALACVALGVRTETGVVYVLLPLLGVVLSLLDNVSRIVLQRSTHPTSLGPLFACLGLVSGLGQLAGSAVAQVLLAVFDLDVALVGVGVLLVVIAAACWRPLSVADANSEVPVVEMTQLARTSVFASLPPGMLEPVARAAERVDVVAGTEVVTQGEPGDEFYAVIEGEFDVAVSGEHIRTLNSGEFFGEVALLTGGPRTATVTAIRPGVLLAIERGPFLVALSGHEASHAVVVEHIGGLRFDDEPDSPS
jgi:hypothetical protein